MNAKTFKVFTILILSVVLMDTAASADDVAAKADIHFAGTSTLHDFEGEVSSRPFTAIFEQDDKTGELQVTATTALEVQNMTTNHPKRDKNMFKMLDLAHFSNIQGSLDHAALSEDDATKALLHLKIRDVENDVWATLSNVKRGGKQISCTMTFPVSLSAFQLKAPSVLGMIRVGDTVLVECTITGQVVRKIAGR